MGYMCIPSDIWVGVRSDPREMIKFPTYPYNSLFHCIMVFFIVVNDGRLKKYCYVNYSTRSGSYFRMTRARTYQHILHRNPTHWGPFVPHNDICKYNNSVSIYH